MSAPSQRLLRPTTGLDAARKLSRICGSAAVNAASQWPPHGTMIASRREAARTFQTSVPRFAKTHSNVDGKSDATNSSKRAVRDLRRRPRQHQFDLDPQELEAQLEALDVEIGAYDVAVNIGEAFAPPASWYTRRDIYNFERRQLFKKQWVCVDAVRIPRLEPADGMFDNASGHSSNTTFVYQPNSYQTGIFGGVAYIVTCNAKGELKAFHNICTHMGSVLVPPRDEETGMLRAPRLGAVASTSDGDGAAGGKQLNSGPSTEPALVGTHQTQLACPYHGWRFNLDGRLAVSTSISGTKEFRPKHFNLVPIQMRVIGPMIYLNFGAAEEALPVPNECAGSVDFADNANAGFPNSATDGSLSACSEKAGSSSDTGNQTTADLVDAGLRSCMSQHGYEPSFADLVHVKARSYVLNCNWKVFLDNYGDGCFHCSYAHPALAANIDENAYSTECVNPVVSAQIAPASDVSDERFSGGIVDGRSNQSNTQTLQPSAAVYACVYPNVMYNRYGPWLDTNIVKPLSPDTCAVQIDWFLSKDYVREHFGEKTQGGTAVDAQTETVKTIPGAVCFEESLKSNAALQTFIAESLKSSDQVQQEDIFLCENVQAGMSGGGFDRGRYIAAKQRAGYHFHQQLARDYQIGLANERQMLSE